VADTATKEMVFGIRDGPFHQELVFAHNPANSKIKKKNKGGRLRDSRYVQFYTVINNEEVKLDVRIILLDPADNSSESFSFDGELLSPLYGETEVYGFYNSTRKVGWLKLGKRPEFRL
jgi:hypothetical protein